MARTEAPSVTLTRRVWAHGAQCNIVAITGAQDAATTPLLMTVLASAGEVEDADVIVDMAGVTFIDTSAIGAIVWAQNRLRAISHSLEIRAPSHAAFRLLEMCNLVGLIRVEAPTAQPHSRKDLALASWVDVPNIAAEEDDENSETAPSTEMQPLRTAAGSGP